MPSLIRRESIGSDANLTGHNRFEFIIRHLEKRQEFSDQNPNVALVDQGEAEIERPPSDADIGIPQAFQNRISMPLHRVRLYRDHLDERIQSNVSDVVVLIRQELSQDVHSQDPQTRVGFDIQDG